MLRKILYVDDDYILRTAVERRLASHRDRFGVVTAKDGFDAVGKLKEHPVSVVVLDLIMPRMDGISLISHIKQYYPDIPIIIVSALGDAKVREVARNSGAFGYLNKPFLVEDLLPMIQQILAGEAEGGIMNNVSPSVFMQLMEMDAKTCTIRMLDNQTGRGGIFHFSQGQLLDARVGDESGLDAAYQIFSWDRTTIFISNDCKVTEDKIASSLGPIIMQAAGMKDENEQRPDDYSEGEQIAALSDDADLKAVSPKPAGPDAAPGIASERDRLAALGNKLRQIPGVEQVVAEPALAAVVENLQRLGKQAGFGRLVLAHLNEAGEASQVVVPTTPVSVVKLKPNSSADQIRDALYT